MRSAKRIHWPIVFAAIVTLALAVGERAAAQGTIEVTTTLSGLRPPARLLAMRPGTQTYLADLTGRWGHMSVPPGRYEVLLVPQGEDVLPVRYPPVNVSNGQTARVVVNSGLELIAGDDVPPLPWWQVKSLDGQDTIAQVVGRWGLTPLPAGRYRVSAAIPNRQVQSDLVTVAAGSVARVELTDLGIGHVRFDMPPRNTRFHYGDRDVQPILQTGDDRFDLSREMERGQVELWLPEGPVVLERRSGSFVDPVEIDVAAGTSQHFAFDLEGLLQTRGMSAFTVPAEERPDWMTIVSARGDRALFAGPPDLSNIRNIVPGGAMVRLRWSDRPASLVTLTPGAETALTAPQAVAGAAEAPVSLQVEAPPDQTELAHDAERVAVVGSASARSEAGVTKIVLLVDSSGSTGDPSGADLDGDGRQESILAAEKAALRSFVDALEDAEAASPGTAFAVSLVEFGDTAQAVLPLVPMTSDNAAMQLEGAIGALAQGARGGSTFYGRAIDAGLRLLAESAVPGPRVMLLVTDGKPSQIEPAIDAAGRAGLQGTILHTVGLGPDFRGRVPERVAFPPLPESGPGILSVMAGFGAPGGLTWALPKPADIVDLVPTLPILSRQDADIAAVEIVNQTLGIAAETVDLRADGAFSADLPVAFGTATTGWSNIIRVVALSNEGETADTTLRVFAAGRDPADIARETGAREALEDRVAELSAQLAEARAAAEAAKLAAESALVDELKAVVASAEADARAAAETAERRAAELSARDTLLDELKAAVASAEETADEATASLQKAVLAKRLDQNALESCAARRRQCAANLSDALDQLLKPVPTAEGLRLTVPGDVLFDFGADAIRPDAEKALRLAGVYLQDHQKSDLVIEGHTDTVGSEAYNSELSLRRARAVAAWLAANAGLEGDRIDVVGLGESQVVAAEADLEGTSLDEARQRNRRVEIRILK